MTKIYVVTEGNYSSYTILGVFSTKKKADSFLEVYCDDWDARVETYVLDEISDMMEQGYSVWYVNMGLNGDVLRVGQSNPYDIKGFLHHKKFEIRAKEESGWTYCRAKSRDEAVKIASERLAQYLERKERRKTS